MVGGPIDTIVTWTLKEEGGTTHLHLEQTGFEKEDQAFNGAKYGWAYKIEELKKMLEEFGNQAWTCYRLIIRR